VGGMYLANHSTARCWASRRWAGSEKPWPSFGVNDQLRGNVKVAQSMPEFEGLGRGTLAIAVAHDRKRGGGDVLNEGDGRTLGVDLGVVVYRGAEVGNHPLVNGVFAVVRKPVGDAGSGDGGPEAMGPG